MPRQLSDSAFGVRLSSFGFRANDSQPSRPFSTTALHGVFKAWIFPSNVVIIMRLMQAPTPALKFDRAPIAILGVPFDHVTLAETLTMIGEMIASGQPHYATTVGVDFIAAAMEDVELRHILFEAHLVLAEDKTVVWASKLLGNELPENVTVPNLIPRLLALAEQKNWRVFLLGGGDTAPGKIQARLSPTATGGGVCAAGSTVAGHESRRHPASAARRQAGPPLGGLRVPQAGKMDQHELPRGRRALRSGRGPDV